MTWAPIKDAGQLFQVGQRLLGVLAAKRVDAQGRRRLVLSTRELERVPGDMLHNREATLARATETLELGRAAASGADKYLKVGRLVEGHACLVGSHGLMVLIDHGGSMGVCGGQLCYLHVSDISEQYVFSAQDHFIRGDRIKAVVTHNAPDASGRPVYKLSTRLLERVAGDMLRDRAAVFSQAEETLALHGSGVEGQAQTCGVAPEPVPESMWALAKVGSLVAGVVETVQPSGIVVRVELPSDRLLRQLAAMDGVPERVSEQGDTADSIAAGTDANSSAVPGCAVDTAAVPVASLPGNLHRTHFSAAWASAVEPFKPGELVCAVVTEHQREAGRLLLSMREVEGFPGELVLGAPRVFQKAAMRQIDTKGGAPPEVQDQGSTKVLQVADFVYGIVKGVTETTALIALHGYNHNTAVLHRSRFTAVKPRPASKEDPAVPAQPLSQTLTKHLQAGELVAAVVTKLPDLSSQESHRMPVVATYMLEQEPGSMLWDREQIQRLAEGRYRLWRWGNNNGGLSRALWAAMWDCHVPGAMHKGLPSLATMQHWLNAYRREGGAALVPVPELQGLWQVGTITDAAGACVKGEAESRDTPAAAAKLCCSRGWERWQEAALQVMAIAEDAREARSVAEQAAERLIRLHLAVGTSGTRLEAGQDSEDLPSKDVWEVLLVTPEAALLRSFSACGSCRYGCLHASNLTRALLHAPSHASGRCGGSNSSRAAGVNRWPCVVDRVLKPGDKLPLVVLSSDSTAAGQEEMSLHNPASAAKAGALPAVVQLSLRELEVEPGDVLRDAAAVLRSAVQLYDSRVRTSYMRRQQLLEDFLPSKLRLPTTGAAGMLGGSPPPCAASLLNWLTETPKRALQAGASLAALVESGGSWEQAVELVLKVYKEEELFEAEHLRALMPDLQVGAVHRGIVVSVKPYGAFIRLDSGVICLLHVSRISQNPVPKGVRLFEESEEVTCMIRAVDFKKGRVQLSTKELEPTPGDMLRNKQLVYSKAEERAGMWARPFVQA